MGAIQRAMLGRTTASSATYAYWNPADKAASAVLSDSDKVVGGPGAGPKYVRSVTSKSAGKWRVQFVNATHADTTGFGFASAGGLGTFLGDAGAATARALWGNYGANMRVYSNGAFAAFVTTTATNDVFDLLLDIGAGNAWWRKNGVVISGDPVAGTGAMATFTPGMTTFIAADPYAAPASTRLRTDPAEMAGSSVSGFTDGWPI